MTGGAYKNVKLTSESLNITTNNRSDNSNHLYKSGEDWNKYFNDKYGEEKVTWDSRDSFGNRLSYANDFGLKPYSYLSKETKGTGL